MTAIKIELTGLPQLLAKLTKLQGPALARTADRFVGNVARTVILPAIKAEERFIYHGKKPGTLARKTTAKKVRKRTGEIAAYSVRARAPHNVLVQRGTRRHTIRPKKAGGVLVFRTLDGRRIVTNRVQHPGARPNPFVARAARRINANDLAARLGKELLK